MRTELPTNEEIEDALEAMSERLIPMTKIFAESASLHGHIVAISQTLSYAEVVAVAFATGFNVGFRVAEARAAKAKREVQ